ncbi:hypothetical protein IQ235_18085 [Oscillatoriales cyanobacterium LEGE 11467]|uniref:Ycf66 family protein n=1 Tax=Zarconia navalis LEGE 11467 TaxID=1828826 RepID=A0A928W2D6_9CYAN|nr:Ycf66 family protein [Zarconia navalis]MBE9042673.1 hypothetical protein [Zarconia navalis LEGE 11467]
MVNFGFGLAGFIGLALVAAGVGLYVLRSLRPTLARDHDIFFAAVALLCGGILMFQGWRLDPILLFGQFLMTGSAAFFAVESIRLRGIVTQQAKRNTPIVDDERSVSSSYQAYGYEPYEAELEEIEPARDYPPQRTDRYIPGSREGRRPARDAYSRDPYSTQSERRRPPSRSASGAARPVPGGKKRTRPPRPPESPRRTTSSYDGWEEPGYPDPTSRSRPTRPANSRPPSSSKRPRPSSAPYASPDRDLRVDATPVDYTDYDRPSSSRTNGDMDGTSRDDRGGRSSNSPRSRTNSNLDLGGTSTGYNDYSASSYSDYSLDDDDAENTSTDYTQYPYSKPPTAKPKKDLDLKSPPSDYDDYPCVDRPEEEDNSSDRFDNDNY